MGLTGRSNRSKFHAKLIKPLLEAGLLEMTVPDKPTSSKQKYVTTELGRRVLRRGTKS